MVKQNIVLFLGAGASSAFGKPTTAKLKENLKPKDDEIRDSFRNMILSCPSYEDFEHIYYNAITIRDFINSSAGDFFKYISEVQNALHTFRGRDGNRIHFHETIHEWDAVVESLENDVFNNYRWSKDNNENLQVTYDPLFNYLKENSNEITVCTTNYDKAIENYCEQKKYCFVDGFQEIRGVQRWVKGQFYYPPKISGQTYINLYKLHGSLDWKQLRDGDEIIKTNEEGKPVDPKYRGNLLIYPTLDPKPIEGDPFTTIIGEFIQKMSKATLCIVIGFSFRDEYITKLFVEFKSKKKLIIIDSSIKPFCVKLLGLEVPTQTSIVELTNGIQVYNVPGDNTDVIVHNMDKSNISDIVRAIDILFSGQLRYS